MSSIVKQHFLPPPFMCPGISPLQTAPMCGRHRSQSWTSRRSAPWVSSQSAREGKWCYARGMIKKEDSSSNQAVSCRCDMPEGSREDRAPASSQDPEKVLFESRPSNLKQAPISIHYSLTFKPRALTSILTSVELVYGLVRLLQAIRQFAHCCSSVGGVQVGA